jgi:hypothetical protein
MTTTHTNRLGRVTFWDTTPYDGPDSYREDTSTDGRWRVVSDAGTVTIHDHRDTFAANPVCARSYPSWTIAHEVADELITLQPEGTDWLAWAIHYLTEMTGI